MQQASAIREMAAARNAACLAAAFFERTIQIWDLEKYELLFTFDSVFSFGGNRLALSPDGRICVAANWKKGKRGGVAAYNARTGSPIWHRPDIRQTQSVRFSCAGDVIRCGLETGPLQQLDANTGATIETLSAVTKIFDSPFSNVRLLETRNRGFRLEGTNTSTIPHETFALLDAAFSPNELCLSEAGGPVRCVDCYSGIELWRYDPPAGTHVLSLCYRSADRCFYGVQREYQRGTSRRLVRVGLGQGRVEEVRPLDSWEEEFLSDGDALVTSSGEVVSVANGETISQLKFPQKEYSSETNRRDGSANENRTRI